MLAVDQIDCIFNATSSTLVFDLHVALPQFTAITATTITTTITTTATTKTANQIDRLTYLRISCCSLAQLSSQLPLSSRGANDI